MRGFSLAKQWMRLSPAMLPFADAATRERSPYPGGCAKRFRAGASIRKAAADRISLR